MSDIGKRLRASIRFGAIHGSTHERSVCESQMKEAANRIEKLEAENRELREALQAIAVTSFVDDEGVADCLTRYRKCNQLANQALGVTHE